MTASKEQPPTALAGLITGIYAHRQVFVGGLAGRQYGPVANESSLVAQARSLYLKLVENRLGLALVGSPVSAIREAVGRYPSMVFPARSCFLTTATTNRSAHLWTGTNWSTCTDLTAEGPAEHLFVVLALEVLVAGDWITLYSRSGRLSVHDAFEAAPPLQPELLREIAIEALAVYDRQPALSYESTRVA